MAQVSLLHLGDGLGQAATFAFEHAMAHRALLATMSPLTRFSVVPYLLDPMVGSGAPAAKWNLNHQQAHDDSLRNVQSQYYWPPITTDVTQPNPTPPPPTITVPVVTQQTPTIGLRIGQNLIDNNLGDPRQLTWWMFQNFMEHYVAATVTVPAPAPKPSPQPTFPFW